MARSCQRQGGLLKHLLFYITNGIFVKSTFYYDQKNSDFHLRRELLIDEAFMSLSGQQSYTEVTQNQRWNELTLTDLRVKKELEGDVCKLSQTHLMKCMDWQKILLFPFIDKKSRTTTTSLLFWGCRHIINAVFNLLGDFLFGGSGGKLF